MNLWVGLGRQMDFDDHTRWLVAFIIFIVLPSSGFFNKQDIILVGVTWHMAAPWQHYDVNNIGSLFWPPHNVSDNCLCWDDWLALTWDGKRRVPMAHHTETLMNRNLQEFWKTKCLRGQVNQISAQQGTTPKEGRGSAGFSWIRNALFANQQKTTKKIL